MSDKYGKILRFPVEKTRGPFGEVLAEEFSELNRWVSNLGERVKVEGQIIYLLVQCGELTFRQILEKIGGDPSKVVISLAKLVRMKSINYTDFLYSVSDPGDTAA